MRLYTRLSFPSILALNEAVAVDLVRRVIVLSRSKAKRTKHNPTGRSNLLPMEWIFSMYTLAFIAINTSNQMDREVNTRSTSCKAMAQCKGSPALGAEPETGIPIVLQ
jgi:hypothetical protein